ncbi:MAG: cell division protein FtsQ/DivIB [Dethiobacteria bacterium]|nr:FtsQ-type POTRA domain-containing protein [Bacillota bacterium]
MHNLRNMAKVRPLYNKDTYGQQKVLVLRRKNKNLRRHFLVLLIFFVSSLMFMAFLRSPFFTVRQVQITGNEKLSYEELMQVSGIKVGSNIWENSLAEIKDNLQALVRVDSVEVKRHFPGKLEIVIKEKEPVALIPYQSSYLELSPEGLLLGTTESFIEGLLVVTGIDLGNLHIGGKAGNEEQLAFLQHFFNAIPDFPELTLSELNLSEPLNAVLFTAGGLKVCIGSADNLIEKLETLVQILPHVAGREQQGYLDLRPQNPVFKPY